MEYNREVNNSMDVDVEVSQNISNKEVDVSKNSLEYTTVNNYTSNRFVKKEYNSNVTKPPAGKKIHSVRRIISTAALVIVLLIVGFTLYIRFFVDGPEETISKCADAISKMDINAMMELCCPRMRAEYKGLMGVGDVALSFLGIGGSMETLSGLFPIAAAEHGIPKVRFDIINMTYSGGIYDAFPIKTEGLAKLLASDVDVSMEEYENNEYTGNETIHLRNYGKDGWLIEDDLFGSIPGK